MEIRTGSSDSNRSRHEPSSFDRVQRRSNESQYGRKEGSDVKRELEEKGQVFFLRKIRERVTLKTDKRGALIRSTPSSWSETSRKIKKSKKENIGYKRSRESGSGGPERKIRKGSEHRVHKRALSSNYTKSLLPKCRKRGRREETVTPTTNGYNLRPRSGKRVLFRPTMEMKTQQGVPVRARKSKGKNYNPYMKEQTRIPDEEVINNKRTRKGGANTSRTISLEVLIGDANYKS
ncbi:uncharacterized protein TNCV_2499711 [Trichonephila clavipes]|nr:uncharacterized protein TNCV_2499711 [Trichonephila clavipes]